MNILKSMIDFTRLFDIYNMEGYSPEFCLDLFPENRVYKSIVYDEDKVKEIWESDYILIPISLSIDQLKKAAYLLLKEFLKTKRLDELKEDQCVILKKQDLYGIAILGVETKENE